MNEAYRRLMVVVFTITISTKAVFLVVVVVSGCSFEMVNLVADRRRICAGCHFGVGFKMRHVCCGCITHEGTKGMKKEEYQSSENVRCCPNEGKLKVKMAGVQADRLCLKYQCSYGFPLNYIGTLEVKRGNPKVQYGVEEGYNVLDLIREVYLGSVVTA